MKTNLTDKLATLTTSELNRLYVSIFGIAADDMTPEKLLAALAERTPKDKHIGLVVDEAIIVSQLSRIS